MSEKLTPLTSVQEATAQNFTKSFCATLPGEKEVLAAAKAFCATLPGPAPEPTDVAKSFCATLPSQQTVLDTSREAVAQTDQPKT